jgi:putative transposase
MKKSRFTEEQVIHAMRRLEAGEPPKQLARELGVSEPTLNTWKKKYLGMGVPELRKLKAYNSPKRRISDSRTKTSHW